jgi:hypothetical protein
MNKLALAVLATLLLALPTVHAADKGTNALQASLKKQVAGNKALSKKVQGFVNAKLIPLTSNSVFVSFVTAQNAKKVPLTEIQAIDKKWIAAEEELPIQKEVMSNDCAGELVKNIKALPGVKEAFVMDDQGAVVCENALTSDYWQGDEAKWQKSFNDGKGGVDAGKVKFDKSANANLQQVSLPIIGKDGKVIGAVTFGLSVDQL